MTSSPLLSAYYPSAAWHIRTVYRQTAATDPARTHAQMILCNKAMEAELDTTQVQMDNYLSI